MDAADDSTMHIVIFPWLAFGHLLPALELAERLAARGHRVSFISTPRNLARLPPVRPALARLVDLVALPLPRVDGLPDSAESTNDVPYDKFELHRMAFDGLATPFAAFLDAACAAEDGGRRKPDWVVVDFIHHWVAAAAQERNVPCAMFMPCAAGITASAGQPGDSHAEQRQEIGQSMSGAPAFEAQQAAEAFATEGASGPSLIARFVQTVTRSRFVAVRSCPELEPNAFPLLARLCGKPAVPLGLLPPQPVRARGVSRCTEDDATMRWLDAQPAKSVVYVALGTEAPLRVELLRELAHGLELAGARFLWALRPPVGADEGSIIPDGFADRNGERGLVTTRWVPQVSVLAHGVVGAFLTHCGWGSVVEGLQFGHPLIMLPIFGDQGPNARLMEARQVGVLVPRDEKDGSFDRAGVARAVRAVVAGEEGRVFAANARKLQAIVADRARHERCIDGFIQHLRSCRG
ncbi:UDP-glycosyltransferase 91C1 [Dichanthelium oligosanthes]|uniref:Glycosyltransferase n=1 Tax=Dichanthelium oligosanthes TaxID=888268 RepID=A0A1E5VCK1_9POAL|nr:UDP-glycosyltransferase 91C1 [Dichanthelium oligosanthes]